ARRVVPSLRRRDHRLRVHRAFASRRPLSARRCRVLSPAPRRLIFGWRAKRGPQNGCHDLAPRDSIANADAKYPHRARSSRSRRLSLPRSLNMSTLPFADRSLSMSHEPSRFSKSKVLLVFALPLLLLGACKKSDEGAAGPAASSAPPDPPISVHAVEVV